MMCMKRRRGQSTGEYAVLFAIVLGGVIMMQGFVKSRIAGAIQNQATAYQTSAGYVDPTANRTSNSASVSNVMMNTATAGNINSSSNTVSNTTNF